MAHKEPKNEAISEPRENKPAQEAAEEITSAVTPQAGNSAERADEDIMGDYFRNSPIKNGVRRP